MNPRAFDLYVRTLTTAFLAIGITFAAIYAIIVQSTPSPLLIGWAGIVIGGYLGAHVSMNGQGSRSRSADAEVTVLTPKPHEEELV